MIDSGIFGRDAAASGRGGARRVAICQAACELLAEVGYDRMTMDAIANQAKASKATIYRLWPDKPQLVAEALKCRFGTDTEPPDTGSLRGDLLALMTAVCEITGSEAGRIMIGVMTAAAHDPRLAETLDQTLFADKEEMFAELLGRAARRGELRADIGPALLHEVMHSMIFGRGFWNLGSLDAEFARHVVDDILIPALTHRKA